MKLYITAAIATLTASAASAQTVDSLGLGSGAGAGAIVAGIAGLLIIGAIIADNDDSTNSTN